MTSKWELFFSLLLTAIPASADVIATQTFDFTPFFSSQVEATVTVTVLDNYHGDFTKEDWIYTINNLSFTTTDGPTGPPHGIEIFGSPCCSPAPSFASLGEATLRSWLNDYNLPNTLLMGDRSTLFCAYGCDGVGYFFLPTGIMPGQTGTVEFSFLKNPAYVIDIVPAPAGMGILSYYIGNIEVDLRGVVFTPDPVVVPEPGNTMLTAAGFLSLGLFSRRMRQHIR